MVFCLVFFTIPMFANQSTTDSSSSQTIKCVKLGMTAKEVISVLNDSHYHVAILGCITLLTFDRSRITVGFENGHASLIIPFIETESRKQNGAGGDSLPRSLP
jgi:hypothetical protein